MLKRLAAILLCLMLLPMPALGEETVHGRGASFRLTFAMEPGNYPEGVRTIAAGLADLLDVLTLEGELLNPGDDFDLRLALGLGDNDRARIEARVFPLRLHWVFSSPLLGDELVDIGLKEVLEFSLKTYAHLGIPLQRAGILVSPVVHAYGTASLTDPARPVLFAEEGSRVIPYDALADLAAIWAEKAEDDNALRSWTQALGSETGYDDALLWALEAMPAWVESHVPAEGMLVTVTDDTEVWTAGGLTLLRRETDRTGALRLSLTVPEIDDTYDLSLDLALQPDGSLTHGSVDLTVEEDGETALRLHADGSVPVSLPVERAFSLTWEAEGPAVGGDGVHLCFEGEPTDEGVVLRQMTPDRDGVMLTVHAALTPVERDFVPGDPTGALGVLSLNGDTLREFVERISMPMLRGLLPLIAEAPTSFCQTAMNLLEDTGIFGLITDGLGESDFDGDGEDWEDEEDEEAWDDEDTDDEASDDEDWDDEDWDDEDSDDDD